MSIETRRGNQVLLPRIKTSAYKLMKRISKTEVCLVSKENGVHDHPKPVKQIYGR